MNEWIVQISAGVGPIEVRQFVGKLSVVLAGDLVERGMTVLGEITHGAAGEPKAVQLHVAGDPSVADELLGTYVLVARSPERGRKARKRWFVGVELFHYGELIASHLIEESEVRFSTTRSGGPGGQHVNKTESAVRAVHEPTGIAVKVSAERSQHANRKRALTLIRKALRDRYVLGCKEATKERRHHHHQFSRGNAVRSFRLDRRGRLVEEAAPR